MSTNAQILQFKYPALPTNQYIRLLELKPVPNTTWSKISVSLRMARLDEAPPYDALSYTWGNPMTTFSERQSNPPITDDRNQLIECSGRSLKVTENLIDALLILRDSAVAVGPKRSSYLWIDSICINQDDLAERAIQVSIMDTIYEKAVNVLVWSGMEDEFTNDAFNTIERLSQIPRERHVEITLADWYDQDRALARLAGPGQTLTPYSWAGLVAFLNRPLFSRVWIVQEVSLARNVVLLCGTRTLPWSMISKTLAFLTTTGWHDQISADFLRINEKLVASPGPYRILMQSNANLGMPAIYMESTRRGIIERGHKVLFRHLINVHRCCKASDPRDMIYALLGIAWRDRPPFSTQPESIVPDYKISVQDLYTKVARTMLQTYGDLRFLCHVQNASITAIQGLPSWVPDYSVDLRPAPLEIRNTTWSASGDLKWNPDRNPPNHNTLSVQGIRLDRIRLRRHRRSRRPRHARRPLRRHLLARDLPPRGKPALRIHLQRHRPTPPGHPLPHPLAHPARRHLRHPAPGSACIRTPIF